MRKTFFGAEPQTGQIYYDPAHPERTDPKTGRYTAPVVYGPAAPAGSVSTPTGTVVPPTYYGPAAPAGSTVNAQGQTVLPWTPAQQEWAKQAQQSNVPLWQAALDAQNAAGVRGSDGLTYYSVGPLAGYVNLTGMKLGDIRDLLRSHPEKVSPADRISHASLLSDQPYGPAAPAGSFSTAHGTVVPPQPQGYPPMTNLPIAPGGFAPTMPKDNTIAYIAIAGGFIGLGIVTYLLVKK
jgi:hypothetical protein